jgi:hypothetical protein
MRPRKYATKWHASDVNPVELPVHGDSAHECHPVCKSATFYTVCAPPTDHEIDATLIIRPQQRCAPCLVAEVGLIALFDLIERFRNVDVRCFLFPHSAQFQEMCIQAEIADGSVQRADSNRIAHDMQACLTQLITASRPR